MHPPPPPTISHPHPFLLTHCPVLLHPGPLATGENLGVGVGGGSGRGKGVQEMGISASYLYHVVIEMG